MIPVILLLLVSLTYGQITDIAILDEDGNTLNLSPAFDVNIFQYELVGVADSQNIIFTANNENDRFWVQVFQDEISFAPPFLVAEMPVYLNTGAVPTGTETTTFFVRQENIVNTVYEIKIDRDATTPPPVQTDAPTTEAETTTPPLPQPTETQVTTDTPVVALPEQSPNVGVCDPGFIDEIWVELIAQEDDNDGDTENHCAALTVRSDNGEELPIEDTCPCFLAADQDYLYSDQLNCRPNEPTMYTFNDMARWCYGEEAILEGPTDNIIAFNKSLDVFNISEWSGVDDEYIYPGQKMRQTFIANDMDAETGGNTQYMLAEFDSCQYGTWEEGDAIIVEIGFTEVYRMEMEPGVYSEPCEPETHYMIVPLEPYFDTDTDQDYHEFTLGFTSNLAGARDDEYFSIEPTYLETFTRSDVSTFCMDVYSYNASVNYPIFVQETSGFIWNYAESPVDSIRLHLEVEVPRSLYDFTIDFDNGNTYAGYDESRVLVSDVNDPTSETYWTSDLLTEDEIVGTTQNNCGYETWTADIPWSVFNENGGGGVEHFEAYSDGTNIDNATDWYLFGSTTVFTGHESISAGDASRDWTTERYSEWRVPFIVRFQRIVFVETDINIVLCPEPDSGVRDPYCTITHVGAIVEQVQANTVYDLETQEYRADVNLKIDTQTFYPYMLINGNATDDPPEFWENLNQTYLYPPPLEDGTWFPPYVHYIPADYVPSNTEVAIEFTWLSEDTDGCTYNPVNEISLNLGRSCAQYWNMYIQPLNGACYIDGDYVVTWSARCFYEKPVCTFNTDLDGNTVNTVAITFTVHSTNMCPEIVHEVDIFGEMCSTGRYDYARCADAQSAAPGEDILTYFQDDVAHFFITTGSNDAKIIYTEILEIWVEQDFNDNAGSDAPEPAVLNPDITPVDYDFNGLVKLWDSSENDNSHEFTSSTTGVTETVDAVIESTMTSNDFVAVFPDRGGLGTTDEGVYAGFQVRLDNKIFPRSSDRWLDATFRVKLLVWYEGWGNSKPTSRRMLEEPRSDPYSMGGNQNMWVHERIHVQREVPEFVPCFVESEQDTYTLTLKHTVDESFDSQMSTMMNSLLETESVTYMGYTQDKSDPETVVVAYRSESTHWDNVVSKFTYGDFSNAPFLYDMTVTDVYCMDAHDETSLLAVTECALGKPCTFLPGNVALKDYYGQNDISDDNIYVAAGTDSSVIMISTAMTFIWALLF